MYGGGGEASEMNARVVLLYPEIKTTAANCFNRIDDLSKL